jgi:hypothetical protein
MVIDVTGSLDFESNSKYPKARQKEIATGRGSGLNSLNFEAIR